MTIRRGVASIQFHTEFMSCTDQPVPKRPVTFLNKLKSILKKVFKLGIHVKNIFASGRLDLKVLSSILGALEITSKDVDFLVELSVKIRDAAKEIWYKLVAYIKSDDSIISKVKNIVDELPDIIDNFTSWYKEADDAIKETWEHLKVFYKNLVEVFNPQLRVVS